MSIGFIYPSWLRAKAALVDALYERERSISRMPISLDRVVDDWMRSFMFELGFEVNVNAIERYKHPEEMERHIRQMAGRALADKIIETKMYMRTITHDSPPNRLYATYPERTYAFTVLIAGVPEAGTGLGTREAKLLKFSGPEEDA